MLLRDKSSLSSKESKENREWKKPNLLKSLLKLKDRNNLSSIDLKERKKLRESDLREKLLLLSMKKELIKKTKWMRGDEFVASHTKGSG